MKTHFLNLLSSIGKNHFRTNTITTYVIFDPITLKRISRSDKSTVNGVSKLCSKLSRHNNINYEWCEYSQYIEKKYIKNAQIFISRQASGIS